LDGASQRTYYTPRASLCAVGARLQRKEFFRALVQAVQLGQKVIKHQPLDKVKAAFIGLLAGISGRYQTDRIVRTDVAVQAGFGLQHCAQQATIHDTLDRFESETVMPLRTALNQIFQAQSRACRHLLGQEVLILDLDLSAELTSKHAEQATKGYFPGHRNAYGWQHSRILAAPYDEIVAEHLSPGNTKLAAVMAHALHEAEPVFHLTPEQRSQVVIRTDSAGGAEEQIDGLLAQGYHVHLKLYAWKRAVPRGDLAALPGSPDARGRLYLHPLSLQAADDSACGAFRQSQRGGGPTLCWSRR